MKRKIIMILVFAAAVGSFMTLTADERGPGKGMNGDRPENKMEDLLENAEVITITGKLKLVNGEMAKIVSDGVTYTIMAPWDQLVKLELKDGMTVTLEGAEIQQPMQWDEKERSLMITKITINGETTEIDHSAKPEGMPPGDHEMMGENRRN